MMTGNQTERPMGFYSGGNEVYILGKRYPVESVKDEKSLGVLIKNDKCEIRLNRPSFEASRFAMSSYHRHLAGEKIVKLVKEYAKIIGVTPKNIRLKDLKTRWGSCSSKSNLNFNWRLSMASEEVIEYVVIHELCHLIHMNHSKEFWGEVEKYCPQYKVHREWLKSYGHLFF